MVDMSDKDKMRMKKKNPSIITRATSKNKKRLPAEQNHVAAVVAMVVMNKNTSSSIIRALETDGGKNNSSSSNSIVAAKSTKQNRLRNPSLDLSSDSIVGTKTRSRSATTDDTTSIVRIEEESRKISSGLNRIYANNQTIEEQQYENLVVSRRNDKHSTHHPADGTTPAATSLRISPPPSHYSCCSSSSSKNNNMIVVNIFESIGEETDRKKRKQSSLLEEDHCYCTTATTSRNSSFCSIGSSTSRSSFLTTTTTTASVITNLSGTPNISNKKRQKKKPQLEEETISDTTSSFCSVLKHLDNTPSNTQINSHPTSTIKESLSCTRNSVSIGRLGRTRTPPTRSITKKNGSKAQGIQISGHRSCFPSAHLDDINCGTGLVFLNFGHDDGFLNRYLNTPGVQRFQNKAESKKSNRKSTSSSTKKNNNIHNLLGQDNDHSKSSYKARARFSDVSVNLGSHHSSASAAASVDIANVLFRGGDNEKPIYALSLNEIEIGLKAAGVKDIKAMSDIFRKKFNEEHKNLFEHYVRTALSSIGGNDDDVASILCSLEPSEKKKKIKKQAKNTKGKQEIHEKKKTSKSSELLYDGDHVVYGVDDDGSFSWRKCQQTNIRNLKR